MYHALNRILAEDIHSDVCHAPFQQIGHGRVCLQKIRPQKSVGGDRRNSGRNAPTKSIGENQCARIMTGAMVPEGADFVVMKEHVETLDSNHVLCTRETSQTNICLLGEDVNVGELVIKRGEKILPSHIAILASVGCWLPLSLPDPFNWHHLDR